MSVRRVTVVCSSRIWAGTEKWSLRAAEQLHKSSYQVAFATRSRSPYEPHLREQLSFLELPFGGQADLGTIIRLAAHLRNRDAVIVTTVRDYWLGGLAAKLAGVPLLLRLGIVRRLRDNYLMDRLRYSVLPKALVVNAQAIADTLAETPWMRSMPVHVMSNGVDAPGPLSTQKKADLRTELGVPEENLLVLGVGRLTDVKRWNWLVKSASTLRKQSVQASVVIFGEGDQREKLEALVRAENLESIVQFPGYTPRTDRWLSAADIFALPSRNEGLANAMLEAMGRGVPCVVTASGGVHEHFRDGEELMVAATEDESGFTDRLLKLAGDAGLRDRIGNSGLEMVRKSFSWDAMTKKLIGVLDSLEDQR